MWNCWNFEVALTRPALVDARLPRPDWRDVCVVLPRSTANNADGAFADRLRFSKHSCTVSWLLGQSSAVNSVAFEPTMTYCAYCKWNAGVPYRTPTFGDRPRNKFAFDPLKLSLGQSISVDRAGWKQYRRTQRDRLCERSRPPPCQQRPTAVDEDNGRDSHVARGWTVVRKRSDAPLPSLAADWPFRCALRQPWWRHLAMVVCFQASWFFWVPDELVDRDVAKKREVSLNDARTPSEGEGESKEKWRRGSNEVALAFFGGKQEYPVSVVVV
uniref:Uncharacterized protein n=1 Tax=Trichuris muris TaxID=70415 RepID=A0A5S6QWT4_TRIMR